MLTVSRSRRGSRLMGVTDGVVIDLEQVAVAVVGDGYLLDEYSLVAVADFGDYRLLDA